MAKRGPKPGKSRPTTYPDQVDGHMLNIAAFERKIQKGPNPNDCWVFTGPKHRQGYGFIGAWRLADQKKIQMTAHRASYRIYCGPITQPNINHTCHNTACVNPQHLYQGTQKENMQDMIAAGRVQHKRGPYRPRANRPPRDPGSRAEETVKRNRNYKYTEEEIQFMRTASLDELQARYNKTRRQASALRYEAGRLYRWLPWPTTK